MTGRKLLIDTNIFIGLNDDSGLNQRSIKKLESSLRAKRQAAGHLQSGGSGSGIQ
jgi:hypothetical protein